MNNVNFNPFKDDFQRQLNGGVYHSDKRTSNVVQAFGGNLNEAATGEQTTAQDILSRISPNPTANWDRIREQARNYHNSFYGTQE